MRRYRITRWTRSGQDRLYVKDRSGAEIGWYDLRRHRAHPTGQARWDEAVDAAIEEWRRKPWDDLAANKPGAAVTEAAKAHTTWWRRLGRALGIRTADWSWRKGAAGERAVGRTLRIARLLGWRSIHAVPIGPRGADIDHVLVGPGGVVTINTKHHRGGKIRAGRVVVFVRNRETRYTQSSIAEAERASRLLSASLGYEVTVTPVIVFVGAAWVRGRKAAGVRVLTRAGLLPWLLFRGPRLGAAQRDEIYAAARQSTTWRL